MNPSDTSAASAIIPITPISVNLRDGIAWTTNWRESNHFLKARAFTFDADEFAAILKEPHVKKIRLYVALAIDPDPNNANGITEKLLCVGVNEKGEDIIYGTFNPRADGDDGTGIYDFSNPCPPLCNANNNSSPLN